MFLHGHGDNMSLTLKEALNGMINEGKFVEYAHVEILTIRFSNHSHRFQFWDAATKEWFDYSLTLTIECFTKFVPDPSEPIMKKVAVLFLLVLMGETAGALFPLIINWQSPDVRLVF